MKPRLLILALLTGVIPVAQIQAQNKNLIAMGSLHWQMRSNWLKTLGKWFAKQVD